jgi:hypothetical protein
MESIRGWETGRFADIDHEVVESVASRGDLIRVVETLLGDLIAAPDECENATLARFPEALAAVLRDVDGPDANRGEALPPAPTWTMIAEALVLASGYE